MPLALEPDQTIEISLKSDESKPLETRPAFIVRFMSSRDRNRLRDLYAEAVDFDMKGDYESFIKNMVSIFQISLVGWHHLKAANGDYIPFDPTRLPELLTDVEILELARLVYAKTELEELDRKNSGSPSDSGSAASVPTAAAPKIAATDPAPPSL